MRTTLTLEDDVALRLERLRAATGLSFKEAVNQALRAGLDAQEAPPPPRAPYRIQPVSTGAPRVELARTSELLILDDEAAWTQEGR